VYKRQKEGITFCDTPFFINSLAKNEQVLREKFVGLAYVVGYK